MKTASQGKMKIAILWICEGCENKGVIAHNHLVVFCFCDALLSEREANSDLDIYICVQMHAYEGPDFCF